MRRPWRILTMLAVLATAGLLATPANAVTITAAGDIGDANGDPGSVAAIFPSTTSWVLPLGDECYETGTLADCNANYNPTWGNVLPWWGGTQTIKQLSKPVPGNHEYSVSSVAQGYRDYFNTAANGFETSGDLWYTWRQSGWRFIALDSEAAMNGGTPASPQYTWLKGVLQTNTDPCVLAYWHRARFASGAAVGNYGPAGPVFKLLWQNHADVVLTGHLHAYERFDKQDYNQVADPAGVREFVVGTGGAPLADFAATPQPNSAFQAKERGVLKLVLTSGSLTWKFIKVDGTADGKVVDSGSDVCNP